MTVDTGWVIAAERNIAAAFRHLKAMTLSGQVLVISPGVVVEAVRSAGSLTALDPVLSRLQPEDTVFADGRRAAQLMRQAARISTDARATMDRLSAVDGLVAAMAERLGGIVYTGDPGDLNLLRQAGARIVVERVPF